MYSLVSPEIPVTFSGALHSSDMCLADLSGDMHYCRSQGSDPVQTMDRATHSSLFALFARLVLILVLTVDLLSLMPCF